MKRLAFIALLVAAPLVAQDSGSVRPAGRGAGRGGGAGAGWRGTMDTLRARQLYVSKDPNDLRGCDPETCARQIANKHRTDSVYAAKAPGAYEF